MSPVNHPLVRITLSAALVFSAGLSTPAWADSPRVSQVPLSAGGGQSAPPLNMLVMGKDHKNYYEAYNDASDLNGDGKLDIGYKPEEIDYYGYFNSYACYDWDSGKNYFKPVSATTNKKCSGHWSGDFLNYVATGRFDAMRKVLYGGWREVDSATETVLQGAYFPQDAHSWGKEYKNEERDGYLISDYTPLSAPSNGQYHLFAVTTFSDGAAPKLRVLNNSKFRIWNWVSIEGPVADNTCFDENANNQACVSSATTTWELVPKANFKDLTAQTWKCRDNGDCWSPSNLEQMDSLFTTYGKNSYSCGSGSVDWVYKGADGNPFHGNGCGDDNYMSRISGKIVIETAGNYKFSIDGDDAVDLFIDGTHRIGWYGGHSTTSDRNAHSNSVYLSAGEHSITFRHQEANGGDQWGLYWEKSTAASTMTDYFVRVLACPKSSADLRESNCKQYGSGSNVVYKPTGILHDFGEATESGAKPSMYFGLMTGSQYNNLRGGVLRRNLSDFSSEIDPDTGQFKSSVDGIANALNHLRMIGGGYAGKTRSRDTSGNWAWGNGTGNCGSFGDRELKNGECRMWGNPIGEMMLETLSYIGGGTPTSDFISNGSSEGVSEENTLGLKKESWKDPYKSKSEGGGDFLSCSKPVMTVISDINPSYDSDVPGNPWATSDMTNLPATLSGFSLQTEGQKIWNVEFGAGSKSIYIGQVGTTASDGAPTLKSASSFGNIRGLSPEEPTKAGSYSSAAVASYGWTKSGKINELTDEKVRTYAVAVASPLPRIEFPVDGKTITLVPFAKTASGTFGGGTRKPTNTIVDFYVETYANMPGMDVDDDINNGDPYAVFRINYEDVEQGNDHDMDAIVRYEVKDNGNGTINVNLTSEYAAGSANQNMGYVITGTTKDGVYLEVRDSDSSSGVSYGLNTPPGRDPGYCQTNPNASDCVLLPLSASRTFKPSSSAAEATDIRDPLWYAAKFGGFTDADGSGTPNVRSEWDSDNDGTPDNYFLVTNALALKEALRKAFNKIIEDTQNSGGVAASGSRATTDLMAYVPEYSTKDWTGDLRAHKINPATGALTSAVWSAKAKLAAISDINVVNQGTPNNGRNVYYIDPAGANASQRRKDFTVTGLGGASEVAGKIGTAAVSGITGMQPEDWVNYLRGDQRKEVANGGPFRNRSSRIGDIFSQPVVLDKASYGYLNLPAAAGGGYGTGGYAKFVEGKEDRVPVAFVAANDGFVHAFNASDSATDGGKELFAIAPGGVLSNMAQLADPGYTHRYYVDGSPTQGDAYLNGSWKTVLVGNLGAGGKSIYALDVTDPAAGTWGVLWEYSEADLGLTLGSPKIARLPNGKWAAIFGGTGYDVANNKAHLYIVDLETGSLIKKIKVNDEGTDDLPNGIGTPSIIDLDGDGTTDVVYAGDYYGNLWKFDLTASGSDLAVVTKKLFTATDTANANRRQPITGGVTASIHPVRGQMVFFGTGRYLLEGDNAAPTSSDQVQSFYGIWDDAGATVTRDELVAQSFSAVGTGRSTSNNAVNWATSKGWYIDLKVSGQSASGERFIGQPTVALGRVFFTTFVSQGDECEPGGTNWINAMWATSGAGAFGGSNEASQALSGSNGPMTSAITIVTGRSGGDEGREGCDPSDSTCVDPTPPDENHDGEADSDLGIATPKGCTLSVDLLTAVGLNPLLKMACGRQSWRQVQ